MAARKREMINSRLIINRAWILQAKPGAAALWPAKTFGGPHVMPFIHGQTDPDAHLKRKLGLGSGSGFLTLKIPRKNHSLSISLGDVCAVPTHTIWVI